MEDNKFDFSLLLMRLVFGGFMLINHGWGKFLRFFEEGPLRFGDPIGLGKELSLALAVFAEVGCAFLIAIGLFTRLSTIPAIITMLVAAFVAHWADPFGDKEHALLFLTGYVVILLLGPGRYSVDSWWDRRRV